MAALPESLGQDFGEAVAGPVNFLAGDNQRRGDADNPAARKFSGLQTLAGRFKRFQPGNCYTILMSSS
jgi:hypothetical protein